MVIHVGLVGEASQTVEPAQLASAFGSGSIEVFATPALIALMERAACQALEGQLSDTQTSVGTRIDVRHLAPTPLGVEVRARAELIGIDGRTLVFRVEAFDPVEKIGEGTHERAVVDATRLVAKATSKVSR